MDRDEDLRASCFARLAVLQAQYGDELPYPGVLGAGFQFRGRRVPFLNFQKGIYKAAIQRGPAALSVQTSWKSPYADEETSEGFYYDYRAGPENQPDNRALRTAAELGVPVVYFVATRARWYRALYPYFVAQDFPRARRVLVVPGKLVGHFEEPEPVVVDDRLEREYIVRETKVRLHQGRFRGAVLTAYEDRCTVCRLRETRLLDAAHITPDATLGGQPLVSNGLSMCTIHHRAFDQNLIGVSPDYEVRVSERLLADEDGPMLDVLKRAHAQTIVIPSRRAWKPNRVRLAERFDRFTADEGSTPPPSQGSWPGRALP